MSTLNILSVDGIDATQGAQIQTVIERHSDDWWHRQENLWIFESEDSVEEWQDRLRSILHNPGSSLLLFKVRQRGVVGLALRRVGGIDGLGRDWLREKFARGSTATEDGIETYYDDGKWKNKVQGSQRAENVYATKAEAESAGRDMAKNRGVEHVIKNKDGTIAQHNSYGTAPHPPKG